MTDTATRRGQVPRPDVATATIEVVVPVYDEERSLPGCVDVLEHYLRTKLPFAWTITVVDNASTDDTRAVAKALANRYPNVRVISRGYNQLIRGVHGSKFADAQCGFKAARTDAIRPLLERIEDDNWFFGTELLLLAEHNGLRIHEVPVDWVEDTDSRVALVSTAWEDVRGLVRVARAKANGSARLANLPQRPDPVLGHPNGTIAERQQGGLSWQLVSFATIGALSTTMTLVLYGILRSWLPVLAGQPGRADRQHQPAGSSSASCSPPRPSERRPLRHPSQLGLQERCLTKLQQPPRILSAWTATLPR